MSFRTPILLGVLLLAVSGCSMFATGFGALHSINPQEVAPTVTGAVAESPAAPDEEKCIENDTTGVTHALKTDVSGAVNSQMLAGVKGEIQKQTAVKSILNFYLASRITADTSGTKSAPAQKPQPANIGINAFKDLHNFLNTFAGAGERVEFYELEYFKGNFVDHFGNSIKPSSITEKNQDQEIQNLLTVFLEAVIDAADDYYYQVGKQMPVPYWGSLDSDKSSTDYYLSGKSIGRILPQASLPPTNKDDFAALQNLALVTTNAKSPAQIPTFIAYAYHQYYSSEYPKGDTSAPADPKLGLGVEMIPISDSGCGMTPLKVDALVYVSQRAGVLSGAEAGALLGAMGGANFGLPIVLGKVSIGDNQTLRTVVQAVLSEAAERATLASAESVLLKANIEKGVFLDSVLKSLTVQSPSASPTSSQNKSGG